MDRINGPEYRKITVKLEDLDIDFMISTGIRSQA